MGHLSERSTQVRRFGGTQSKLAIQSNSRWITFTLGQVERNSSGAQDFQRPRQLARTNLARFLAFRLAGN
jgi:hypothetical protein